MAALSLHTFRPGWRLRGAVCLAVAAFAPAALGQKDPPRCRLEIKLEGHPEPGRLDERLREDAQRVGACTRAWSLRVSPGPGGQFVLALWNGSDLETRWARNAREVEAVAEMLLRTAVEHDPLPAASSPGTAASAGQPATPATSSAPAASSAPGAASSAPANLPASAPGPGLWLGPSVGAGVRLNIGPSAEVGLVAMYGSAFRFGLWPAVSGSLDASARRIDVSVPAVLSYTRPLSSRVALGAGAGVGVEASWARGKAQGASASNDGIGLLLSAWPEARVSLSPRLSLLLALPIRFSTTTDEPVVLSTQTTTVTPGNSGAAGGVGPKKTVTTTTYAPSVADRLGGWSIGVSIGFLR